MSNRKVFKEGTRVYIGSKHAHDLAYSSIKGEIGTIIGHHYITERPLYFPLGLDRPALIYHVKMDSDKGKYKQHSWNVYHEDVHLHRPEALGDYSNEDVLCILEDKEPF